MPFGLSVGASAIGVDENSTIRIAANALTVPAGHTPIYWDDVLDVGAPPFIVQMRSAPTPIPAPPSAPTTTTTAPAPAPAAPCVVPKLTGLTQASARASLTKANRVLGVIHTHRARGKTGIVLAAKPAAGTRWPAGTKVAVTVRAQRVDRLTRTARGPDAPAYGRRRGSSAPRRAPRGRAAARRR